MDLEKFYSECISGKQFDTTEIYEYIRSFENVIIRGAAAQGQAVAMELTKNGIEVKEFWDMKAEEYEEFYGIKVKLPFADKYDDDKTVIIYCIPNHVIMGQLIQEIRDNGYSNIIRGDILYSGCICEYHLGDTLSTKKCWQSGECRAVICKKVNNIVKCYDNTIKEDERIDLTYTCFIINSICNLSCKHCVQYINNYPQFARNNVPVEQICKDIDIFFDMVDSVGTVSVMGGETFMHPDISKIARKFSEKKNIGFISFPTNGLYPIKSEQLEGIQDDRILIAFGYYLHRANEKQKEIYYKNIELVKSMGINYTESLYLPTWIVPSGIYKRDVGTDYMKSMKNNCKMPPRNLQIKNGKVHTCDRGVAIYNMGIADYPSDYLVLSDDISRKEIREKFRKFIDRDFYYTCGHCGSVGCSEDVESAVQGIRDVLTPGKDLE